MVRCGSIWASLSFSMIALAYGAASVPAVADTLPESLRIQQNAQKAYSRKPVVPINRGNAHHRDFDKDLGASGGSDGVSPQRALPALPNATVTPPVQAEPKPAMPN